MYLAVAEKQGVAFDRLDGTLHLGAHDA